MITLDEATASCFAPKKGRSEVLRTAEDDYAAIKSGTAKLFNNTAEMFAEWDKEDDD